MGPGWTAALGAGRRVGEGEDRLWRGEARSDEASSPLSLLPTKVKVCPFSGLLPSFLSLSAPSLSSLLLELDSRVELRGISSSEVSSGEEGVSEEARIWVCSLALLGAGSLAL